MPKKRWKVHGSLNLRYPGTKIVQVAELDEIVEELLKSETTDSGEEVRVYRVSVNTFQTFIVSRSELDANATTSE